MNEWDHLISAEQVSRLHVEALRRYGSGGLVSPAKDGCIEGSLGNAWSAELYQDQTPGRVQGLSFAGYVLYYLARNHCFVDGNKRVAWLAATWILSALDLDVDTTSDEAEAMILAVIQGTVRSGSDVVRWFADRVVADPA